jgi:hypothetical protein
MLLSNLSIAYALLLSIAFQPVHSLKNSLLLASVIDTRLAVAKDEFNLLRNERIGNLRIGLSQEKVKQMLVNCKLNRKPEQLWGADGAYHQTWQYAECGITLGMVSQQKGAAKSIESITIDSPSRLSTKQGIRIGSPKKMVVNAYKSQLNNEMSNSETLVAGSIYGGLIFQFQNGRVSRIFLGAAAE